MPRHRLVALATTLFCLTAASTASAATFHSAPGATRATAPCTEQAPCKLSFALGQAFDGDDVALAAGTYDHAATDPLEVRPGVVLHGSPGAARPLIEQTAPYRDCFGCTILELRSRAVLRDVDVTQTTEGGGAVEATAASVIKRSALRGRRAALLLAPAPAEGPAGGVYDTLAVAIEGTGVVSYGGGQIKYLENVTAIGLTGDGVGIRAHSSHDTDDTLDAVNTIARGGQWDVQAFADATAGLNDVATVKLRYSSFRLDRLERHESDPAWPNARIETFDNNHHDAPLFASPTDYHQAAHSPTVDAGRASGLIGTLDLDGQERTFGAKPDIGADEWHPAPEMADGRGQMAEEPRQPEEPRVPADPEPRIDPQPLVPSGIALKAQTVTVKKNVAAIAVECPAARSCAGTLALTSGKVKVGSARFDLAPGKRAVVRVKLTRAARELIARKRKLKATATAQQSRAAITLKLARR
jgi:hypothetical protein